MSGWNTRDPAEVGLDPAQGYTSANPAPKWDSGLGRFVPGPAGGGTNPGPWTSFTMESPDGTLWTFTVDNTGALTTTGTELDVRVTDEGIRITDAGGFRLVETV